MTKLEIRFLDRWFEAIFRYFGANTESENRALVVSLGVAVGCFASLVILFHDGFWIVDAGGKPLVRDFAAFWAAGHAVLSGSAAATYDPRLQHAAEVSVIGHRFNVTLGWSYPPVFLIVVVALALLPYTTAFLLWCGATLAFHAGVVARIAERRSAALAAIIAPWTLLCVWVGQNGLLTAGLIGLALLLLERRPLLSGLVLGLLSYKPQFGVLFPLALAAGGHWRAFGWAALSVLTVNVVSASVFGFETLEGFFRSLALVSQTHLNGGMAWKKLQSVYGLYRSVGGGGVQAMAVQLCWALGLAVAVVYCWRKSVPYSLKAALLSTASVLATPYVFAYDLPILAIAIAYLHRERVLDKVELASLAVAVPLTFLFLYLPVPTGLGATVVVAALVGRRMMLAGSASNAV